MKSFLKSYRHLIALALVLTVAISGVALGVIRPGAGFLIVGLWQLSQFAISKRQAGVFFISGLTDSQINEFEKCLRELGAEMPKVKGMQEKMGTLEKLYDNLHGEVRTLRKSGVHGGQRGVSFTAAGVPQVTEECAKHLGSMFVIKAVQDNKIKGSQAEELLLKAAEFMGMETKAAIAVGDIPLPVGYGAQIVELVYIYGAARKNCTVYPLSTNSMKLPRLKTGDGKGWFDLTRGQVILFIDFRSLRILGWALEPRKSYSSLTIRSLCTHVFGEFGVPEILYFERGIWKSATLLKGKTEPVGFTEISQGLREFGVTFKHAIRPRTKVVERIGGMFQDIAEAEPGYCGRDERRDAPESLRKQMAEVEARKVHPSKYFYNLDQWNQRISQLVNQYNAETQQGHILAGLSPDQAFEKFINPCPPMQFRAGLRYLLAHDKRLVPVTTNGVTIQIGKTKFNYRGQEIAHLVGREVLAWFDPENPETIVVTNPDRTNPICVARSQNPSALESLIAPESGTLGRELARIEDQASYMKTRFNVVKAKFALPQRQLLAAAQIVELGEQITSQKNELTEKATRRQRQRSQANQLTQRTGIAVPERAQDNLDPAKARRLADFLDAEEKPAEDSIRISAPETSLTQENGKSTYHLKPFGGDKIKYVDYLLGRLTEFRKAGASFGQQFQGGVSFGVTKKIVAAQLQCNLHDGAHFDEVCSHLKTKIDATILGKRNCAAGFSNYHEFSQTQEAL